MSLIKKLDLTSKDTVLLASTDGLGSGLSFANNELWASVGHRGLNYPIRRELSELCLSEFPQLRSKPGSDWVASKPGVGWGGIWEREHKNILSET